MNRNHAGNPQGAGGRPDDGGEKVHWTLRRGVSAAITVAALVAAAVVVLAVWWTRGSETASSYPVGLRGVVPAPDAQVPRQSQVGARLDVGWEPRLVIDGVPIPRDHLNAGTVQLGEYFYSPAPGKPLEQLPTGRICAVVTASAVTTLQAPDVVYEWCFVTF